MRKINFTLPVLAVLIITSCKKDLVIPTPGILSPTSSTYHFPLTIGSYWIYQEINVDSSENISSAYDYDSLYVSSDTIINLKTYSILKAKNITNPSSGPSIVTTELAKIERDSSGYIVDTSGNYIKDDNFSSILYTINVTIPFPYLRTGYMTNKDIPFTVPAGTFSTINYQEKIIRYDSTFMYGIPKYNNQRMTNSVGVVYKSMVFSSCFLKTGIQLMKYHIAP